MTLREKLLTSEKPEEILWGQDPVTMPLSDLVTILRLRKIFTANKKTDDPLAHLSLEATWFVRENLAAIKARIEEKGEG